MAGSSFDRIFSCFSNNIPECLMIFIYFYLSFRSQIIIKGMRIHFIYKWIWFWLWNDS